MQGLLSLQGSELFKGEGLLSARSHRRLVLLRLLDASKNYSLVRFASLLDAKVIFLETT